MKTMSVYLKKTMYGVSIASVGMLSGCFKSQDLKPVPVPSSTTTVPSWNYENTGIWSTFTGDADCGGKVESPINIDTTATIKQHFERPLFTYNYRPTGWTIFDNTHTVEVTLETANSILLNSEEYPVAQFHFHKQSEHEVNGDTADMELHIVHQNAKGLVTVLAIFLKQDPNDRENPFIAKLWNKFPTQPNVNTTDTTNKINLTDILPADQNFYQYTGSLTTPPCTEGVNWILFKQPVYVSSTQIRTFQNRYAHNHRPLQPINNRQVISTY